MMPLAEGKSMPIGRVRRVSRMHWAGKEISVVGLGKSNLALTRYLTHKGAVVTARDKKVAQELGPIYAELEMLGVQFQLGEGYLDHLDRADAVFLTPGMKKDFPQIQAARRKGVLITSEIDLLMQLCRAPIVGITGSNGKTTTTTLTGALLEAAGLKVYVGGNIGTPLIERVDDIPERAVVVLELSSFQLELATTSPRIAVVTNLAPNHLDIHGTMNAYVDAKRRIFRYQNSDDLLVLNRDNSFTRDMAESADARVAWFSRTEEVNSGAFISDGRVVIAREGSSGRTLIDVCGVEDIPLLGAHNLENVLASCAVAAFFGATAGTMREVITSFTGVAHRLELVREAKGVSYYNDSIATSPSRAMAGLLAFDRPIHLIAGGYDKLLPFDEFAKSVSERCSTLFLMGETAEKIERAVQAVAKDRRGPRIVRCDTLEDAVYQASRAANPGDVVLLSPACASYDMFPNFEVRGEKFRKAVHRVTEQESPHASALGNER